MEQEGGGMTVHIKIVWKQNAHPGKGIVAGEDSGIFPMESFGRACAYNLGKTVKKIAGEFVEGWCGLEGCDVRVISIEEVE